MVRRKLKGKNSEKLKEDKRKKMEKTLERMDKTREKDTEDLRNRIEIKIKIHQDEIFKIKTITKENELKQKRIDEMRLKLEGAIVSLQELLNPENK